MEINTRRNFFSKTAAMAALVTGALKAFGQQQAPVAGAPTPAKPPEVDTTRRPGANHTQNGSTTFPEPVPMTATPKKITSL